MTPQAVSARQVLGLALPALGVLAANPLYLLLDTAVVGRLGVEELAALAAGTIVQGTVTSQLTFLSYGTTARASRLYGSGRRSDAVAEGVQSSWVAVAVGVVLASVIWLFATPIAQFLTNDVDTAAQSVRWMHVAALGIPLSLLIMAGNGWMRGVQDTRTPFYFTLGGVIPGALMLPFLVGRFGLVGSAWANVLGVTITSVLFVVALARQHDGSWAPRWDVIRNQLVMGRDLVLRSLSFQISMITTTTVAGRFGVASLAAQQILVQLWNFISLVLDSLGIAGQTLTGSALGRGDATGARDVGWLTTRYCMVFAGVIALVFAMAGPGIWSLFTADDAVRAELAGPWAVLIVMILICGVVFALDGALLGAGDVAFLRTLTIGSVLGVYVPITILAYVFDWGLIGVWFGTLASVLIRLVGDVTRFRSMKWASTGSQG